MQTRRSNPASQKRGVRDIWMVLLGFTIGLALVYGIIIAFYQPEIFRLQDEVRNQTRSSNLNPLMYYLADSSLSYIGQKHPETASKIPEGVAWQGGRETPSGTVGHETYRYQGEGWTVTIEWNVVSPKNLVYTVTATHDSLVWKGDIQRGNITEVSFKQ
ncbi:MAG: hypothetical protein M1503_07395 [Thaumarchaeota archaeon]|nr:hypothetical protein [Nitrososphaerota archaeon]MCL5318066.1 hypothetical protein [Nitrososphaerota archaeon]